MKDDVAPGQLAYDSFSNLPDLAIPGRYKNDIRGETKYLIEGYAFFTQFLRESLGCRAPKYQRIDIKLELRQ